MRPAFPLLAACLWMGMLQLAVSQGNAQESTPAPLSAGSILHPPPRAVKTFHDGTMRDLEAVGNRNVGCGRGMGNWYSLEAQVMMGKQYSQQVESSAKMIGDSDITEYVNRVGQNLVRNSDAQVPFTIKVIDADDINAFALPGGFFYVDSGLILAADNEAELAGVMSHEIAHVAACHAARQNTRGQLMNLASIPLIFVGGGVGYAASSLANVALPLTYLQFSREFETDADYLGVQYMYKAGYDPQAFTAFFEKVRALEKHKPGTISKAFETHPPTPDRILNSQKEINLLLPPQPDYKVDTSEFQEMKGRLALLENRHSLDKVHDRKGPTLRRHTPDASPGSEDKNGEGGHPTLTRRSDNLQ